MESLYWVLSWLCHRTCRHCYEDRFRPYYGDDLKKVVQQARESFPQVIRNLPERMTYLDHNHPNPDGTLPEKRGRIILAGGEILLEPVREPVLYPALEMLRERYRDRGGVYLIVQTTGDIVNERIIQELLDRGVWMISVSGLDDYHDGLDSQGAQQRLKEKVTRMFEACGMTSSEGIAEALEEGEPEGAYFHFFGATPGSWIGALWPRGRAHQNELSTATLADNFCNAWSGGLNFLQYRYAGSEVSIDPAGDVYPCCIKTKAPIGNLTRQPLEDMLDELTGDPVYEAISMGHPERMGIQHGWSVDKFLEASRTTLPSGRVYQNLCIGCDRFHEEVLMKKKPKLVSIGQTG